MSGAGLGTPYAADPSGSRCTQNTGGTPVTRRLSPPRTAYLWDYLGQTLPYDDDQLELSRQMITYWGRLAAFGDPNGSGTPDWPKYRATAS